MSKVLEVPYFEFRVETSEYPNFTSRSEKFVKMKKKTQKSSFSLADTLFPDKIILKNGGAIDDRVDETTTHYICEKSKKLEKDIVPVKPSWILDSYRLGKLQSPFLQKYIPAE